MKKTTRNALLFACVAGLSVYAGAQMLGGEEAEVESSEHLVNRVWVERWPEGHRDIFGKFMALRTDDGRFGIVGRSSAWRHFYEVFLWAQEGDTLLTAFPQERHKQRFTVRTWACEGEAPAPFELCLRITAGNRHVQFYSLEEWEVRPHAMDEDLARIEASFPELGSLRSEIASVPQAKVDMDALPETQAALPGFE